MHIELSDTLLALIERRQVMLAMDDLTDHGSAVAWYKEYDFLNSEIARHLSVLVAHQ